ncbi:MAG: hypothetical protein PQJ46_13935 [Spirochaetales bacterium]|nr:hypothetical protein [Spirochaetales bacterium]
MEFIPRNYFVKKYHNFYLHCHNCETVKNIEIYQSSFELAYSNVSDFFKISFDREIHLCIYRTLLQGQEMIPNLKSPSQLLVPLVTEKDVIISFFSIEAFPENNNISRLLRHLMHELTHIWISIITETFRFVGKGRKYNPIPEWIDEGISEIVSLYLSNRNSTLSNCSNYYKNHKDEDFSQINFYKFSTGKVLQELEHIDKDNIIEFLKTNKLVAHL